MIVNPIPVAWLSLADLVVKTSIVLSAAAVLSFVLRRRSAALRHLIWTLALGAALVLPMATVALPKWQVPLLQVGAMDGPAILTAATDPAVGRAAPSRGRPAVSPAQPLSTPPDAPAALPAATGAVIDWGTALLALWAAGMVLILGRIGVGLLAVSWMSRRTSLIADAPWLPLARGLARDLGIAGRLRFLRSRNATMPVATGVFRPAVVMPADADTWSEERLRVVLLHELAHVRRRDCLTHIVAQAACAFHWFNPLAWMAVKRARAERERACDDLVLAFGTRGPDYADQLLEMARVLRGDRFPGLLAGATLAMAHRSQLEGRLIAILDPRVPRSGVSRRRALAAMLVTSCAVMPLAAVQPWGGRTPSAPAIRPSPGVEYAALALTAPEIDVLTAPEPAPAGTPHAAHSPAPSPDPSPAPRPEPAVPGEAPALAHAAAGAAPEGSSGATSTDEAEAQSDPRTVAALTAALKDTDKEVRETAMHALVQLRDPAVFEPLLQALKDVSADVREQAVFGLGQMRDRRAVAPLSGMLKDENPDVREQAAFALGQVRDPAAVEALGAAARDANASVREQAVFALGQIRDRRGVEPLISALKDANADVREQAAFALGQIRDRAAVDALVVAFRDADAEVREQVIFALGQLRDPRAIDALTAALKDPNPEIRRQAAFALGQIAR